MKAVLISFVLFRFHKIFWTRSRIRSLDFQHNNFTQSTLVEDCIFYVCGVNFGSVIVHNMHQTFNTEAQIVLLRKTSVYFFAAVIR